MSSNAFAATLNNLRSPPVTKKPGPKTGVKETGAKVRSGSRTQGLKAESGASMAKVVPDQGPVAVAGGSGFVPKNSKKRKISGKKPSTKSARVDCEPQPYEGPTLSFIAPANPNPLAH